RHRDPYARIAPQAGRQSIEPVAMNYGRAAEEREEFAARMRTHQGQHGRWTGRGSVDDERGTLAGHEALELSQGGRVPAGVDQDEPIGRAGRADDGLERGPRLRVPAVDPDDNVDGLAMVNQGRWRLHRGDDEIRTLARDGRPVVRAGRGWDRAPERLR